jgi:[ribosomal protein S5]-alanine N-acetyltransferase
MLTVSFNPFPELQTERLKLIRLTDAHLDDFFQMRSDRETMQYIARPLAKDLGEAKTLLDSIDTAIENNDLINWGITFRDRERVVGTIGFYRMKLEHHRSEVGYMLNRNFHGQGIAQEALKAVIDYGFKVMRLHSIEGVIDPLNKRSEKLLLKHGFVKEAYFKENFYFEGQFLDSVHYSLLAPRED